jgi:hypothetical protein
MKKLFILIAVLSLSLVGCEKEELNINQKVTTLNFEFKQDSEGKTKLYNEPKVGNPNIKGIFHLILRGEVGNHWLEIQTEEQGIEEITYVGKSDCGIKECWEYDTEKRFYIFQLDDIEYNVTNTIKIRQVTFTE